MTSTGMAADSGDRRLNLFIWSEYIDPQALNDFRKEYSCAVVVDQYEDEESMMAKLLGGGDSLYDVVVPSDSIIPALIKMKLVAPLRRINLPNLKNLEETFTRLPYDPGNRYSVPYQWGTFGLYARVPKGQSLEPTWGLVFDPRQAPGPIVLMDSYREMIGAALKIQGHSLNTTNIPALRSARDLLVAAKRRSAGFEGGVGGKNKVLARGATVAICYNGDAVRGMAEDAETRFLIPREGSGMYVDNLAVLARAPHRDLAETFLNYVLDEKVGARIANHNRYASPNRAAKAHINPLDLKNPVIYPPAEVMSKLEFMHDLGLQTRLYDEVWTHIKSK